MRLRIILALMAWAGCALQTQAQDTTCSRGDIAWVSSAVNANVGTGLGSGRCTSSTVAGAEYNNLATPWGIQGALDCACDGLQIRILGDTGDYGAATASWNNRFDANKTVNVTVAGGSGSILISGWADSTTGCTDSNLPAGCPVEMDFTGGLTNGWVLSAGVNGLYGLEIHGAVDNCVSITTGSIAVAGLEIYDCGDDGIATTATTSPLIFIGRVYIHDTGDALTDAGIRILGGQNAGARMIFFSVIRDVAGVGVQMSSAANRVFSNIIQNTGGDCIGNDGRGNVVWSNTLRDCGGDGIGRVGTDGNTYAMNAKLNLITGAGGWGIANVSPAGRWAGQFAYNVLDNNTLGDIEPQSVLIDFENVTGGPAVTYAGPLDATPLTGAAITVTYPSGGTTITINAGAVPEGGSASSGGGGGGGGVYIPGGPR